MSRGGNYFLLTSLPPLTEPGAPPPLTPAELRARASVSDASALVDVVLLSEDLRRRQALLAGEVDEASGAVLTPAEMAGEAPLPEILGLGPPASIGRHPDDLIWEAYWRHAARVARRRRSPFLAGWVRTEVALRNGLAAARARALGHTAAPQPVAGELAADEALVAQDLAAWAAAPDPLAGWRALLWARWAWAVREEPHFTFHKDEVAGYAVRLLLLRDWRRTMGASA